MIPPRLALLLLLLAPGLRAQVPFDACTDRLGRRIPGVIDNTMSWGGVATRRDGERVILWNQKANAAASRTTQLFLYLHECGHHSLGHLSHHEDTPAIEREADCWAIQLMVDGGMLSGRHINLLEHELRLIRGDQLHLGGDALLASLIQCLQIRVDRQAWAVALNGFTMVAADSFHSIRGQPEEDAEPDIFETTIDAPGTYDCEVLGEAAVRCLVFAARRQGAVADRYTELAKIVRDWLPATWTSTERVASSAVVARQFLAQDGSTGTLVSLTLTPTARLYLLVRRTANDVTTHGS